MGRRHPHVGDDHVRQGVGGGQLVDRPEQRLTVPDSRHDLQAAVGEQPGQALPQQYGVLGDDDAKHGGLPVG